MTYNTMMERHNDIAYGGRRTSLFMRMKFALLTAMAVLGNITSATAQQTKTFTNVDAIFTWSIGNEDVPTYNTDDVNMAVKTTKRTVGEDLKVTTNGQYSLGETIIPAGAMARYQPKTSNAGCREEDMIEYTVTVQKGLTFTIEKVEFDAVKEGTDNAYFSWSCTYDDVETDISAYSNPKAQIRRNNNANPSAPLTHTETVGVSGRKISLRLYISNVGDTKQMSIGKVKIYGKLNGEMLVRTFTDFKIDFRTNPYTVVSPSSGLPTGVSVEGTFHDDTHGYSRAKVIMPVEGPVQLTIGGCSFTNKATVTDSNGTLLATLDTKGAGCDSQSSATHNIIYVYNEKTPTTLTVDLGSYCPYFYAEQTDFVDPCTVKYYDTDGTTLLHEETLPGYSVLNFSSEALSKVTMPSGHLFRGWFESAKESALKIKEGSFIQENLNLYARTTPEETTTKGMTYSYDLTRPYFYQEDHELITITNGAYHNDHGWGFSSGGKVELKVSGNTYVTLTLCKFGSSGTVQLKSGENNVGDPISIPSSSDAATASVLYEGPATTLWFEMPNGSYLHGVRIKDADIPMVVFVNKFQSVLSGTVPEPIEADKNYQVMMPENTLLYREGWTVVGWTDGENIYPLGEKATIQKSVTLFPTMQRNSQALSDNNVVGTKAVWVFDQNDGAPALNLSSISTGEKTVTYTKCIDVNGEKHDVPMYIDATGGKIDNTDSRVNNLGNGTQGAAPERGGQINDNTLLTIPAVYGMKVVVNASNKVDGLFNNNTTHFGDGEKDAKIALYEGDTEYSASQEVTNGGKTLTLTYNGNATMVTVKIVQGGSEETWGFFTDITAVYPVLPDVVAKNVIVTAPLFEMEKEANAGVATVLRTAAGSGPSNIGKRYRVGDIVQIAADANYGYDVTGFRLRGGADLALTTSEVTLSDGTKKSLPNATFTVTDGISTVEVLYTRKAVYKVSLSAAKGDNDKVLGEVNVSPRYDNFYKKNDDGSIEAYYTEGTDVTVSAEAVAGYVIEKWTDNADVTVSNSNSHTFTMPLVEKVLRAVFRLGSIGSVVFSWGDVKVNSKTPIYKNAGSILPKAYSNVRSFEIPTNYTFFKNIDEVGAATAESYTMQYWKGDDGNRYELGKVYSFSEEKTITLTPVFTKNLATPGNRLNNPVIRYDLGTGVYEYYDATSGEMRKVCGQEVNIGKNEEFFWTTQAYVVVLESGKEVSHYRDIPICVNTGERGFMRNGDIPGWASMGPGTALWLTSCAGTKVSFLTYAPVTSTMIDNHIPVLDTEDPRCKPEEHRYVYSYTTESPADHIAMVIGDDYSYYQWIEVATKAANMVTLRAVPDDEVHGHVSEITSESEYEAVELEDGGYSFHQGNRVKITFCRKFGYSFDKIVTPDITVDGEPLTVLQMNSDGTVGMLHDLKSSVLTPVSKNGDGSWGNEGTLFVLKESATADNRTEYELQFNITTHRNITLCFKEKPTYYITYNIGQVASGVPPAAQWVEEGDKYTVPQNTTLYFEGYTLKYWKDDNGNKKDIGQTYKAPGNHVRLFPVFEPNTFNVLDLDSDATAVWHLATRDGAPVMAYERSAGILVTQLKKSDSEWIDLKVFLDARTKKTGTGKFNNTAYNDRMQVNSNSVLVFPTTVGCEAYVSATNDYVYQSVVAGLKKGDSGFTTDGNSIRVTCPGTMAEDSVEFKSSCYCIDFAVTYKKQTAAKPTLTQVKIGGVALSEAQLAAMKSSQRHEHSLSPVSEVDVVMPAITGTADNDGVVTATEATIEKPFSTVTVANSGGILVETYTINFSFATPANLTNNRPLITSVKVNGNSVEKNLSDAGRPTLASQPVNGIVEIEFSRTMKASTVTINGVEYTAGQGKKQTFKYWDLPTGQTFNVTLGAGTFTDIYSVACQDVVNFSMQTAETTMPVQHRTFDYIVGRDGDIDGAIAAANEQSAGEEKRFFIFVPDGEYRLTGNEKLPDNATSVNDQNGKPQNMAGKNNGMTKIEKPNVSLIGQSRKGVVLYNIPIVEGISYTATIHIGKDATQFYCEEMTLENRFPYWNSMDGQGRSGAGRAVAFWDQGNKGIMKDMELWSWQDTYYSSNANADYRGYFENCSLAGVVDWICGNGNIWFEKSDIVIRDRSGNNITAPSTQREHEWGYVFNKCRIVPESENMEKFRGKDWTFARPWQQSPACTFLYTTLLTMPRDAGYTMMTPDLHLRFHEYKSTDANGNEIPLSTRSLVACAPEAGSDDCILTDDQAKEYTVRAVMGGADAFDPVALARQIDAVSGTVGKDDNNPLLWNDEIEIDDDRLQWNTEPMALCYFIFKKNPENGKWEYRTNVAQQTESETKTGLSLARYGSGTYMVRAANQRGGLGAPTAEIEYVESDKYTLTISQTKGVPEGYGYSTICLPYNAKNPDNRSITLYAATAVDGYMMDMTAVDIINKNRGYVVYGKVGTYVFQSTSHYSTTETILDGNPDSTPRDKGNDNCYVLANKPETYGIGFYKYTGDILTANKAWLPISHISTPVLQNSARAIKMRFPDESTAVTPVFTTFGTKRIYDLNGIPVKTPVRGTVYIIDGKKEYRGGL